MKLSLNLKTLFLTSFFLIVVVNVKSQILSTAQTATESDYNICCQMYLSQNYDACTQMGNINWTENIYSARIKAYALLAHYKLIEALPETETKMFDLVTIVQAWSTLDFLYNNLKDRDISAKSSSVLVSEYLDDVNLFSACVAVHNRDTVLESKAKKYFKFKMLLLKSLYQNLYPIKNSWVDNPEIKLQIIHYAIVYLASIDNLKEIQRNSLIEDYWDSFNDMVSLYYDTPLHSILLLFRNSASEVSSQLFGLLIAHKKKQECISLASSVLDFMLKTRDLSLYLNGCKEFKNYMDASWISVKENLADGEYAMETFESPILPGQLSIAWDMTTRIGNYAFFFSKKNDEPILRSRGNKYTNESIGYNKVKKEYPDMEKLYTTNTDDMFTKDNVGVVTYVSRVHSLTRIPQKRNQLIEGKKILMIADIDFNKNSVENNVASSKGADHNTLPRIDEDKRSISIMKKLFPLKLEVLSDNKASIDDFMKNIQSADVLHISTHGIYDLDVMQELNNSDYLSAFSGNNVLKSCKIVFSGYNDNHDNCISAQQIRNMDLRHVNLVFLDACETNAGQSLAGGSYSLAESFHMAGVKNIIANIDPISPKIATMFVEEFYTMLSKGYTYHDAFYQTKIKVCPNQRIIFGNNDLKFKSLLA